MHIGNFARKPTLGHASSAVLQLRQKAQKCHKGLSSQPLMAQQQLAGSRVNPFGRYSDSALPSPQHFASVLLGVQTESREQPITSTSAQVGLNTKSCHFVK
jgi:hypothetical protein